MVRKTIEETLAIYDKFSNINYNCDFDSYCHTEYNLSKKDISYLIEQTSNNIVKNKVISSDNKVCCLTILLSRDDAVKKFFEDGIFTYQDLVDAVKIMPPCMEKIPKNILEDKKFIMALLKDRTSFTAMINNPNYIPDFIREIKPYKENLIKFLGNVLTRTDRKNNYDYLDLLSFPSYLNDQPLYQEKIISKMDIILDKIKEDQTFIYRCPNFLIDNKDFINKYKDILDVNYYDQLPPHVATLEEIRIKCNRTNKVYNSNKVDKDGYNIDWVNKDGKLIKFFTLKNNYVIKSKDDYDKIYRAFIDSKLSPENFCIRYGITPLKGFNSFIKRVGDENYSKYLETNNVKNVINSEYYDQCRKIVQKLLDGKMTFEQFITSKKQNFFITNVDYFYNNVLIDETEKHNFTCLLLDYLDTNSYCLHQNFLDFLNGDLNKGQANYKFFIYFGFNHADAETLAKYNKVKKYIEAQKDTFKREELYIKYIKDGKTYIVDDDVIDQAITYSEDNNIHFCLKGMELLCRRISAGDLTYQKETKNKKAAKADQIISLLEKAKSIEDYLKIMNKNFDNNKKVK